MASKRTVGKGYGYGWKRVKTPDGIEHHLFAAEQLRAVVFNEGDRSDPSWVVRDVEMNGYPTMADAKDHAECIVESEIG